MFPILLSVLGLGMQRAAPAIVNSIIDGIVRDPNNDVKRTDASSIRKELVPVIEHLTNNEPWFRSNVTLGSGCAILGGIATIGTHLYMGTPFSLADYGPPLGAIWGGAQALYGRWVARKPIGA